MNLSLLYRKNIVIWVGLSASIFCGACSNEKQPFEISAEQIQAKGIKSYKTAKKTPDAMSLESCGPESEANSVTVYPFELSEDIPHQLNFSPTSASCPSFRSTADARIFVFNEQNAMVGSGETDENYQAVFSVTPDKPGLYYVAVVPKYQDDSGAYQLSFKSLKALQ